MQPNFLGEINHHIYFAINETHFDNCKVNHFFTCYFFAELFRLPKVLPLSYLVPHPLPPETPNVLHVLRSGREQEEEQPVSRDHQHTQRVAGQRQLVGTGKKTDNIDFTIYG